MTKALTNVNAIMNAATRRMSQLFPGYFQGTSHNHYKDFRWPEEVTFDDFHKMTARNGLGKGIVAKTTRKVWESVPVLQERIGDHDETALETQVAERFADLRLWQRLATADRRSLVGAYAGVILRVADSQGFEQPVVPVSSGLNGLVELIPAWEGQLSVAEWEDDQQSENYGHPKMYAFNEAAVGKDGARRKFNVHPDRVVIWSEDGTIHGEPFLKGGYNDLLSLEKISGAGGEGFWKNAKSAPVIEVDKEAKLAEMARSMGVDQSEMVEAMNEQVADWQGGFDQLLMLQGMQAKALNVTLPSPQHFRAGCLENLAASVEMPVKILVGMQTGERASTEDAQEWANTCMGRRADKVIPNIMAVVKRLVAFGILPDKPWHLSWADLTEATMTVKIERASKMASINDTSSKRGEVIFTGDEIREVVDKKPLSDADKYRDDFTDDLPDEDADI